MVIVIITIIRMSVPVVIFCVFLFALDPRFLQAFNVLKYKKITNKFQLLFFYRGTSFLIIYSTFARPSLAV